MRGRGASPPGTAKSLALIFRQNSSECFAGSVAPATGVARSANARPALAQPSGKRTESLRHSRQRLVDLTEPDGSDAEPEPSKVALGTKSLEGDDAEGCGFEQVVAYVFVDAQEAARRRRLPEHVDVRGQVDGPGPHVSEDRG